MRKFAQLLMVISLLAAALGGHVAARDEEIAGIWHSIGYGLWLSITEESIDVYQTTAVSCIPLLDVPTFIYRGQSATLQDAALTGLGQYVGSDDYELSLKDGMLNFEVGKVNPIQAERAQSLPAVCEDITADTPQNTFETFWHIFEENYAFFDLRGVDWHSAYDQYQPLITAQTTETELFDIFQEMLTPLGDAHVSINSSFNSFRPITLPTWFEGAGADALVKYARLTPDNYLIDEPQVIANEMIVYGHLSETVGYMSILGFSDFAEDGDDIGLLTDAMATVLEEFNGLEAIVIDVRFNPGGDDTNGLFIAGHFTDKQHLVFNKSVWFDNEFHPLMDVYVEPTTDNPFTGSVYLLTSRLSVSAAETFALAMSALPNVTLVGEPTNGVLSDMWFAILPNGWIATLSNERYLSSEGITYENIGVPPDIEVLMSTQDFETGNDPVVEASLKLAQ